MSVLELKAVASLTGVFIFRMLGLFMVLPVLVLYAEDLQGVTPALAGLAIGAYGFTQALLQVPFGWLSDRIGRKPVIVGGLVIFLIGSLVAANADTIQGVIFGRVLQGCGAIAGAIIALIADLTRDQYRTRAMAMVGMGIGLSFCLAMVIGPVIGSWWGLSGLFISNALMALAAILLVLLIVPSPLVSSKDLHSSVKRSDIRAVVTNPQLVRHFLGVFALHFVLMALFVFIPPALEDIAGYARSNHGWIYLAVMGLSFITIIPFIVISERLRLLKQHYVLAVAIILMAVAILMAGEASTKKLLLGLFLFFVAFNFLEACLPSLVSKLSTVGTRGTAMGMFSTSQFLGAALGGTLGGWTLEHWGISGLLLTCTIPTAIWLLLSVTMKHPPYVSSMVLVLDPASSHDVHTLGNLLAVIPGVEEVTVLPGEKTAYLKVDKRCLDTVALSRFGEC